METNDERRKRRLSTLCAKHGGVKPIAERVGLSWESLDQILKGTLLPPKQDGTRMPRSLGDTAARTIESAMDLGSGWLDWPFDAVDPQRYDALTPADQGFVQARMTQAIEECEQRLVIDDEYQRIMRRTPPVPRPSRSPAPVKKA